MIFRPTGAHCCALATLLAALFLAPLVSAQTAPLLPEAPPTDEQRDQHAEQPDAATPTQDEAVDVMDQPATPPPEPMRFYMELATGVAVPIGDSQFGLATFDKNAREFEWSPGFDLAFGIVPPGRFINLGFRLHIGLGPLNSEAWTDALGVVVDDSVLLDAAIYAQYQHDIGDFVLVAGLDGGFVSLGTTITRQSEDGDVVDEIPNKVGYTGFTGGAYVGGMRKLGPNSYGFLRIRYGFRSWRSLETDGPDPVPAVIEDATTLNLGHVMIMVGISGLATEREQQRNR